jgi:hypothetical protein
MLTPQHLCFTSRSSRRLWAYFLRYFILPISLGYHVALSSIDAHASSASAFPGRQSGAAQVKLDFISLNNRESNLLSYSTETNNSTKTPTTVKATINGTVAFCRSSGCPSNQDGMNQSVALRVSKNIIDYGIRIARAEYRSSICNPKALLRAVIGPLDRVWSMLFSPVEVPQSSGCIR